MAENPQILREALDSGQPTENIKARALIGIWEELITIRSSMNRGEA